MFRTFKIFLLCCFAAVSLNAQQDAQYTQWMFNKLSLNPGYAVGTDYGCISCLHRSQWVGLEGAPTSQSLNARLPMLQKNAGFGVSVNHDKIGPANSWSFSGIYAYRFRINAKHSLGIGLQGTLRRYQVDWASTTTIQSGDGLVPMGNDSKVIPNFGIGLYYYTKDYYLGVSMPHILSGDLTMFDGPNGNSDFAREETHLFVMGGMVFDLTDAVKLKPSFLFKYVEDTPLDLDVNASFIFFDTFWAGLSYRMGGSYTSFGESLDLILQLQATKNIRVGFSYDFTLSKLKDYNNGTYEIVLDYCMNPGNERLTNPRFF